MEMLVYRNPAFKDNLSVAFPVMHCLLFLGIPSLVLISKLLGILDIDCVYILFLFLFAALFIFFRFNLVKKSSGVVFNFYGEQLNIQMGRECKIIRRSDVRHIVMSEPLIVLRVKNELIDSVFHIIAVDHEKFIEISSLSFLKKN